MSESFPLNVSVSGNYVLIKECVNGKKKLSQVAYRPSLFVPGGGKNTPFRDIKGRPLKKIDFPGIKKARWYVYEESENHNSPGVYGDIPAMYACYSERYSEEIDFDIDRITIVYIDIEVSTREGFSSAEVADQEITAISMKVKSKPSLPQPLLSYGMKDFKTDREDICYRKFANEKALLTKFLKDWMNISPDIYVGWNSERYDSKYIYNRIKIVLGEEAANCLSPWGLVEERRSLSPGRKGDTYFDFLGVSCLDYQGLYKKFAPNRNQERYSLDHICSVELGERKLSYEEYGTLDALYRKNPQKYYEYNQRDVELVERLEKKLGLISMAITMAYRAKVNFYDVFSPIKTWDVYIYDFLKKRNIQIPPKKESSDEEYPGAFVKEPAPNMYYWPVSFDLDSMYPMNMVQWNISPETLIEDLKNPNFDPNFILPPKRYKEKLFKKLIDKEVNTEYLKDKDITLSASGYHFRKDIRGFLPEILMSMFEQRKTAKNKMKEYEKMLGMIGDEIKDRKLEVE